MNENIVTMSELFPGDLYMHPALPEEIRLLIYRTIMSYCYMNSLTGKLVRYDATQHNLDMKYYKICLSDG